jgi:hypothetical protein
MWHRIRIAILLAVLIAVALGALFDRWRTTDWARTVTVGVFPLNADGREATTRYVAQLQTARFSDIDGFFAREARSWGVPLGEPVHVELYPAITELPPRFDPGMSLPGRILWSLRARYYSWRVTRDHYANIRLFVLYHDPAQTPAVPHSLGLQKGLFGIVHAYADESYDATNAVVIAHELLHTLGATDKYDPATSQPLHPGGYAEPDAEPLHPQRHAEIMAGRIALSATESRMPESLEQCVVGPITAAEIKWAKH